MTEMRGPSAALTLVLAASARGVLRKIIDEDSAERVGQGELYELQ
jgi:hypothetical protein